MPENQAIADASPALALLLSPLGERVVFPPDIPFQAAQARGKALNGESHLRLAFCSVGKSAQPELVERLGKGVAELAAQRSDRAPKVTSALAPTKR